MMRSIKEILSGIGLLLFGIFCILISMTTGWRIFILIGMVASLGGVIILLMGMFSNKVNDKENNY